MPIDLTQDILSIGNYEDYDPSIYIDDAFKKADANFGRIFDAITQISAALNLSAGSWAYFAGGGHTYRIGSDTDGVFKLQQALTALGFNGTESDDEGATGDYITIMPWEFGSITRMSMKTGAQVHLVPQEEKTPERKGILAKIRKHMKKAFSILAIVIISLTACAQQSVDILMRKSLPTITLTGLNGTSAQINLNGYTLTTSSGLINLAGASLNLGGNSLLGSGAIGTNLNRFSNGYFVHGDFNNVPTINGVSIFYNPPITGTLTVPADPVNSSDAVNKSYVDSRIALGLFWVAPCEDIVSTLANSITIGKRYILSTDNHIYTSNGDNTWADGGVTATGTTAYVKTDANIPANSVGPYNYNGSAWVSIGISGNHNDLTAIQGGTANQYYHLTSAEYTFFQSLPPPGTANNLQISNGTNWTSVAVPTWNQSTTGTAAKATILATARNIYGNSFDGSVPLSGVISSVYGGTGSGFTKFSGPVTSEKTFTLPNANANILTDNSIVTITQGGTGRSTSTIPYGLITGGTTATSAHQTLSTGNAGQILLSGGSLALPLWSTATYPSIASTAGKVPISDGTNIIMSTPAYPNASPASGTIIKGDGINFVTSTETYDTPGVAGQVLMSDGTNWKSLNLPGGGDVTQVGTQTLTNKTLTLPKINEDVQVTSTSTDINSLHNGAILNNTSLAGLTDVNSLRVGGTSSAILNSITYDSAGVIIKVNGSPIQTWIPPENRQSISTYPYIAHVIPSSGDTSNYPIPGMPGMVYIDSTAQNSYLSTGSARNSWMKLANGKYVDATSSIQGQFNALQDSIAVLRSLISNINTVLPPAYPTYYVANAGSDAADGLTPATPWQTITKVNANMANLVPGSKILFHDGDTWSSSTITVGTAGTSGNNITIGSYGTGNKPIISATANNPALQVTAAGRGYWTIDGLDLRATGQISGYTCSLAIYFNYWDTGQPGNVPGWIIQNCTFNACILTSGPNILIQNNSFNGYGNANNIYGALVVRGPYGTGAIVQGNTILNYTDRGIWITEGCPNATVRNNLVYNIIAGGDNPGACINIDGFSTPCINAKVYGNTLHDCVRGVIHENADNCETYNNIVYNSEGGFSSMYYSGQYGHASNIKIHHNIIYNVTDGFMLWNTRDISMYNNTIYSGTGGATTGLLQNSDATNVSNITFENNIITGTWTYPIWNYLTDAIFNHFDYNDIVPVSTNIYRSNGNNHTLAQAQALGFMTHGISGDPLLTTPGSVWTLQSGSPCINAGVTWTGLLLDFLGNPLNGTVDIGAIEKQ